MVIRQLEARKFARFYDQLINQAQQNPLDASFNVTITVNSKEYILKIQPDAHRRIVALQALEVYREENYGQSHMLITDNHILSSLLDFLLWQGIVK